MDSGRRVQATIDAQRAAQHQNGDSISIGERSHSNTSLRSVNSIRSQRYVKLKVKQVKTNSDKDSTIASLQEQNSLKDEQMHQMQQEIERLQEMLN
jgi:transposase